MTENGFVNTITNKHLHTRHRPHGFQYVTNIGNVRIHGCCASGILPDRVQQDVLEPTNVYSLRYCTGRCRFFARIFQ
jgi:hypothetical protein